MARRADGGGRRQAKNRGKQEASKKRKKRGEGKTEEAPQHCSHRRATDAYADVVPMTSSREDLEPWNAKPNVIGACADGCAYNWGHHAVT